jgi:SAM-dependent methyltransferase
VDVPGINFDRVAAIYDETRGGERRGQSFADSIAPFVVGRRVAELGVGTGVIAKGLRRHGIDATGVDLSAAMLSAAVERIGPRVALADVDRLPFADSSIDTVLLVWVLQLVDDPAATLREASRVLRPGGRVVALPSTADHDPGDEVAPIAGQLAPLRSHRLAASDLGEVEIPRLRLVHEGFTAWDEFEQAPAEELDNIEHRRYSSLFDVDDDTWTNVVEPVLEQLRALPDPHRPRLRRTRHPLLVWEAT